MKLMIISMAFYHQKSYDNEIAEDESCWRTTPVNKGKTMRSSRIENTYVACETTMTKRDYNHRGYLEIKHSSKCKFIKIGDMYNLRTVRQTK